MIVSEMPGTTRDAVDSVLTWHRRSSGSSTRPASGGPGGSARGGQVEAVSVLLARRAIESADIVVLVVDASQGATDQDAAIAGEADRQGRGIIIAANKWDLMKDSGPTSSKGSTRSCGGSSSSWTTRPCCTSRRRPASGRRGCSRRSTRWPSRGSKRVKTTELNKFVERVTASTRLPARAKARSDPLRGADRASRRRRLCSSPTSPRPSISPISGFSRTGCARSSDSRAHRSGSTCAPAGERRRRRLKGVARDGALARAETSVREASRASSRQTRSSNDP